MWMTMQICSRQHRFLWEDMFVQVENISKQKGEYCKAKSCFAFRLYTHTVTNSTTHLLWLSAKRTRNIWFTSCKPNGITEYLLAVYGNPSLLKIKYIFAFNKYFLLFFPLQSSGQIVHGFGFQLVWFWLTQGDEPMYHSIRGRRRDCWLWPLSHHISS